MSEDGIYGSPAAREKFAREHPEYGNPHPGNGRSGTTHQAPPHHKKPAEKHEAAATTRVNHYSKNSCHVKEVVVFCEHHDKGLRKAAPEEEPEPTRKAKTEGKAEHEEKALVLNVIPHGVMTTRTASGLTKSGQALTDHAQDKYYDQGHDKLEHQHDALRDAHKQASQARANQNHRLFGGIRADMAEGRAHRQAAAYAGDKSKFMKTYGDHVHGDAELYLSQGNPHVDDMVTFRADMITHCSKHPVWTIWDCLTNKWLLIKQNGEHVKEYVGPILKTDLLLPPQVIPASYLAAHSILPSWVPGEKAYWLKGIEPRRYKVHLATCDPACGHRVIHLNVYPLIESGIQISISRETGKLPPKPGSWAASMHKYQEEFEKAVHFLDHVAPGGKVHAEVLPDASFSLANRWKEEDASHEVVWSGSVKIAATLFDLYGEKNFLDELPGYISDVIRQITDVGITLRAGLKADLSGTAEWTQAPESPHVNVSGAIELAGTLYATVRFDLMLRFRNHDVLGGHAHGTTLFSVKGELGFEPKDGHMHMPLDISVQWEKPLEINFLFVYIWGKDPHTYTFLEGYFPKYHMCQVDLLGKE